MDTPAGFCLRDALYTVNAGLIFHHGISAFSINHKGYILHSADTDFLTFYQLNLPMSALCIVYIHPVNLRRKERRLISACSGADFYNNIFLVVWIFRQKQDFKFLL